MNERIIADTGPLVAFLNRRDTHHEWVADVTRSLEGPFYTNEAVVTECCFLLGRTHDGVDRLLTMIQRGSLRIELTLNGEVARVRRLMKKYVNLPMSLAAACVVRMTEISTDSKVLTLDEDFAIYRKLGRQIIPLIAPF